MKKICPLIQKECLEHGCEFYVHLLGKDPQTGAEIDKFGCTVPYLLTLLIENANMTRQNTASVDKVATEVNAGTAVFLNALPQDARLRVEHGKPREIPREHI